MADSKKYQLVTIGPSHFSEKARWALNRYGVEFDEFVHVPVLHYATTTYLGLGRHTVPILISPDGRQIYKESGDILKFVDTTRPEGPFLYPKDEAKLAEIDRLETIFNKNLSKATRVVCYEHLITSPNLPSLFLQRVPEWEKAVGWCMMPLIRSGIRRSYGINPENIKRSKEALETIFATVEANLADGRRYLCGDELTAADITFASLAAPLVAPNNYGGVTVGHDLKPETLNTMIEYYRSTKAGQFVLRLYQEDRDTPLPSVSN